jgi:hypothetical protein
MYLRMNRVTYLTGGTCMTVFENKVLKEVAGPNKKDCNRCSNLDGYGNQNTAFYVTLCSDILY